MTKHDLELRATAIARQFRQLSRSVPRLLAAAVASQGDALTTKSKRRSPRLSPAVRRALRLQGQYMGGMRGLSPRKVKLIKWIRTEKGIKAAIAEIKRMKELERRVQS